ncbi:MAG: universal stress protein [Steroidobacteraceae bacterium]
MKNIFVPTSGNNSDHAVFATALAAATPFGSHLEFYHQRLSVCEAAVRARHVEFCVGPALTNALDNLRQQDEQLSADAAKHFREFCAKHAIKIRVTPDDTPAVTAQYLDSVDDPEKHFLLHARHSDLTVIGRPAHKDLMPSNLIEMLLVDGGRPIIIAPYSPPQTITGTVLVGWKESSEAARALGAALPLLKQARKVIVVSISEDKGASPEDLRDLTNRLAWHGIAAETRLVVDGHNRAPARLLLGAAADAGADLLVVGGYGHGALREAVFGGVTAALIQHAECPVLMVH